MCGIAGFLGAESPRMGERLIKQMCDRIAHRGPDAWGWLVDGEVALGHRRLSIIDLEGGSQPLGRMCLNYWTRSPRTQFLTSLRSRLSQALTGTTKSMYTI